jgi:hypothetical protein
MFAMDGGRRLRLFSAPDLLKSWSEHPQSPLPTVTETAARPGGRVIEHEGGLIRYMQESATTYGGALRAISVIELTPERYSEREIGGSPILTGSGGGWNADGMHHVDAHRLPDGRWLACVDGNRRQWFFDGRRGARRILTLLGL